MSGSHARKKKSLSSVQHQLNNASSVGPRVAPAKQAKTPSSLSHTQHQLNNASSIVGKSKKKVKLNKSVRIMTIDDVFNVMKAEGAPPPPGAPAPAPKKFPRGDKPTIKMKPISDGEAMANLKAGKHFERSLKSLFPRAFKALTTGYNKTSGGGALKAPNRGFTINDLERAMEAMPAPTKVGPPKVYLPGVHNPKSPVRSVKPTKTKSMKKTVTGGDTPAALAGGGATTLSLSFDDPPFKKSRNVVQKSEGVTTMAKTNFNDLFKSELGVAEDVLCACPHCDEPITKSDLAKAGHKGKGSETHVSGPKHGKSSAHVRDQNPEGGTMRGGDGKGTLTPSRGVPGAKKHDEPSGIQNSKGSKTHKAFESKSDDDESSDDESSDDGSDDKAPPFAKKKGKEETKKSFSIRGTNEVQYIDYGDAPGGDAWIAKSIAEGALGGVGSANSQPTQPLDLNNDLTRLLV